MVELWISCAVDVIQYVAILASMEVTVLPKGVLYIVIHRSKENIREPTIDSVHKLPTCLAPGMQRMPIRTCNKGGDNPRDELSIQQRHSGFIFLSTSLPEDCKETELYKITRISRVQGKCRSSAEKCKCIYRQT